MVPATISDLAQLPIYSYTFIIFVTMKEKHSHNYQNPSGKTHFHFPRHFYSLSQYIMLRWAAAVTLFNSRISRRGCCNQISTSRICMHRFPPADMKRALIHGFGLTVSNMYSSSSLLSIRAGSCLVGFNSLWLRLTEKHL